MAYTTVTVTYMYRLYVHGVKGVYGVGVKGFSLGSLKMKVPLVLQLTGLILNCPYTCASVFISFLMQRHSQHLLTSEREFTERIMISLCL